MIIITFVGKLQCLPNLKKVAIDPQTRSPFHLGPSVRFFIKANGKWITCETHDPK